MRAVADANVFVSVLDGRIELVMSPALLAEIAARCRDLGSGSASRRRRAAPPPGRRSSGGVEVLTPRRLIDRLG
jgi:hypothetical protein